VESAVSRLDALVRVVVDAFVLGNPVSGREGPELEQAARPDHDAERGLVLGTQVAARARIDVRLVREHQHARQTPPIEFGHDALVDGADRAPVEALDRRLRHIGEADALDGNPRPRRYVAPLDPAQLDVDREDLGQRRVLGVIPRVLEHELLDLELQPVGARGLGHRRGGLGTGGLPRRSHGGKRSRRLGRCGDRRPLDNGGRPGDPRPRDDGGRPGDGREPARSRLSRDHRSEANGHEQPVVRGRDAAILEGVDRAAGLDHDRQAALPRLEADASGAQAPHFDQRGLRLVRDAVKLDHQARGIVEHRAGDPRGQALEVEVDRRRMGGIQHLHARQRSRGANLGRFGWLRRSRGWGRRQGAGDQQDRVTAPSPQKGEQDATLVANGAFFSVCQLASPNRDGVASSAQIKL
jgi:hypothetical protein